ncbi:PTS transporter subunit EIIC [uncultured Clostridium sp.]|jgi:PTS system cellobiose-specific IIC component|uniref:PTS sugar transporter subunit IIC n=1 Tax=uncultured Clostridium sp. TaxID=59620 RepID=UPI0026305761|nr:PTS transporter subunit EIIC [uncultured Clostridium sp.]
MGGTFFAKFEAFIKKYLMPVANKIDKQPHLGAVKRGMVVLTPILLLGSLAYPLKTIKNVFSDNMAVQTWFEQNVYLIDLLIKLSLGMIGIYAVIAIAYFLSEHYKIYTVGAVTLSAFAFMLVTVSFTQDGMLNASFLDSKGLFAGIFISIAVVEIYRFFTKHKLVIKMPDGVPDFVSKSFELITPTMAVAVLFLGLRYAVASMTDGLLIPEVIMKMLAPAIGSMDNLWVVAFVIMLRLLFWFFGIHSAVLSPILSPVFVQYLAENIAAKEAGMMLPHVVSGGTFSAFANFTGSGVTIGLVIAMLLSKSKRYKKVGQVALVPSLFGINEPVLFGVPVILNPILLIPFILGGTLVGIFPFILMKFDILARPFFDPPYLPLFFEGFLTGMDWKTPFVQLIQILMSIAIYMPFFKILEKQELAREAAEVANGEATKAEVFSADEQGMLDDLDLDF